MKLEQHIIRQMDFSAATFGPGTRFEGVRDHIRKELVEITEGGNDPAEWVDVWLLTMDGLWRDLRDQLIEITDLELATIIVEMRDGQKQGIIDQAVAGAHPQMTIQMLVQQLGEVPRGDRARLWVAANLWAAMGLYAALRGEGVSKDAARNMAETMIHQKQEKNERRVWPDWTTQSPDHAIEHTKGIED